MYYLEEIKSLDLDREGHSSWIHSGRGVEFDSELVCCCIRQSGLDSMRNRDRVVDSRLSV